MSATYSQLQDRLSRSSELLRLALLGAADTSEWRDKYEELQKIAVGQAFSPNAQVSQERSASAREILLAAVAIEWNWSGGDWIEVRHDHFHRLCDARNTAIRLLTSV